MYTDDDLIPLLSVARGWDRTLLIGALGEANGTRGIGVLRHLLATEKGELRTDALGALTRRVENPSGDLVPLLGARSRTLQEQAAHHLARRGDATAVEPFFAWLTKRLGRRTATQVWEAELPDAIHFAVRHDLLARLATLLDAYWDRLYAQERTWLGRVWPGLLDPSTARPRTSPPIDPPRVLQDWVTQDEREAARQQPDDPSRSIEPDLDVVVEFIHHADGTTGAKPLPRPRFEPGSVEERTDAVRRLTRLTERNLSGD